MITLDGKNTSKDIKEELEVEVSQLLANGGKRPHLAAILVGNDGASETYIGAKVKACDKVGFESTLIRFESDVTVEELLAEIERVNENTDIDGLIVQLPLPKHIDEMKVTEAINPIKDVDGFHPTNIGRMALNLPAYLPATPAGILELLERHEVETSGKHCVVIGRSHIVGSPMSILMARNNYPGNCTVTLTHSRTRNLKEITKTADI
jgi:methylenetetrahydrofolate dehydrogenase (NADP+)/methenyltetrahydrofolate cyclohydrolase